MKDHLRIPVTTVPESGIETISPESDGERCLTSEHIPESGELTVTEDEQFELIRQRIIVFSEQLEENPAPVPDALTSREVFAELGFSKPPQLTKANRQKLEREVQGLAGDLREAAEVAEEYEDLIENLLEVLHEYGTPDRLHTEEFEELDRDPHIGEILYIWCRRFLNEIDDVAGTNHHDTFENFAHDLSDQAVLSQVSMVVFQFFIRDQEFLFKYLQMMYWDLADLLDDMWVADDPDETAIRELIHVYKEWGWLFETAVEPVVSVIHFLDEGEVDMECAADMGLRNQVDELEKVPKLKGLAQCLNVDYRNAFSHGGKKGGHQVNPMHDEIVLWYESKGGPQRKSVGVDQFREIAIRTFSAVAALSLLPTYLVSAYATFEIGCE